MDFVKKNYEKILLSVVLLGLVGMLVFMLYYIPSEQRKLAETRVRVISPSAKPLDPLDMTRETNILARLNAPYKLDFSTTNKVFNPFPWQRKADGTLVPLKPGLIGPDAVVVTKIAPLYTILTLDSVETNEPGARYVVGVERQAAALPAQRAKRQHYSSVGEKLSDAFVITAVDGPPDNLAQVKLTLQLKDSGEKITLSKDKPFRRIDGYAADLKYDPDGKKWQAQRIGSDLKFAGDDNIIVAINPDGVILLAWSNQKKTTRPYSPQNSE